MLQSKTEEEEAMEAPPQEEVEEPHQTAKESPQEEELVESTEGGGKQDQDEEEHQYSSSNCPPAGRKRWNLPVSVYLCHSTFQQHSFGRKAKVYDITPVYHRTWLSSTFKYSNMCEVWS